MMAECGEVALAGALSVGGLIVRRLAGAWQGFIGPPTRLLTCSTRVLLNASCSALPAHTPFLRVTSLLDPLPIQIQLFELTRASTNVLLSQ